MYHMIYMTTLYPLIFARPLSRPVLELVSCGFDMTWQYFNALYYLSWFRLLTGAPWTMFDLCQGKWQHWQMFLSWSSVLVHWNFWWILVRKIVNSLNICYETRHNAWMVMFFSWSRWGPKNFLGVWTLSISRTCEAMLIRRWLSIREELRLASVLLVQSGSRQLPLLAYAHRVGCLKLFRYAGIIAAPKTRDSSTLIFPVSGLGSLCTG